MHAFEGLDQCMGDGAAAPEMAQTECVMTVHQDAHMRALMLTGGSAAIARRNAFGENMLVQGKATGLPVDVIDGAEFNVLLAF